MISTQGAFASIASGGASGAFRPSFVVGGEEVSGEVALWLSMALPS
jgi:hypothetical protein